MGRLLGGPCCSLGSSSSSLRWHQAEPWPCAGQSLPHPPGELWGGVHRAGFATAHLNLLLLVWHISPSATCGWRDRWSRTSCPPSPWSRSPHQGTGELLVWKPPEAFQAMDPGQVCTQHSQRRLPHQAGGLRACWAGRPPQSCLAHIPGASHGCSCRFLLLFECWCRAPSLFSSPSAVQSRGWVHLLHVCPLAAPILPSTGHWGTGWSLGSSGLLAPELGQPERREAMIHLCCPAVSPSLGLSLPFVR